MEFSRLECGRRKQIATKPCHEMTIFWTLLILALGQCTQGAWWNRTFTSPYRGSLFQGDIYLYPDEDAFDDSSEMGRYKRTAVRNRNKLWPDGIVFYEFGIGYSPADRVLIRSAMFQFQNASCVRFQERLIEDDYIFITPRANKGCWSPIGRRFGKQTVSLETPSCMYKGVVMHELMHVLGFWHEQARPDRDDYVDINWDNIEPIERQNFMKLTPSLVDSLDQPYDYKSMMHYHSHIFAINLSEATLTPKTPGVSLNDLGEAQRTGVFTNIDIIKMNMLYSC